MRQRRSPATSRTIAEQRAHLLREIVETILLVGIIFVLVAFAIQSRRITDTNMSPQLRPDQLVVQNKLAYLAGGPSRGDVVVYVKPTSDCARNPGSNCELIARVIAIPGDTIAISATSVTVNGTTLNEPYISTPPGVAENPLVSQPTKMGSDQYWLMNDSRLTVPDSRSFGAVSRSNIRGKIVLVFWPLRNVSGVSSYPDTFSKVK